MLTPKPPRPHPFLPKPRRLPERKRMTIAVGILASDGVVVAADSQETVQGYWKGNQGKVWWGGQYSDLTKTKGRSAGVCAVAGAGMRAGYIDALMQKFLRVFQGNPDVIQPDEVERLFEKEATKFHREHVAPYSDYPEVSMVIGYYRNHEMALFSVDRGTVTNRRSMTYAAVGIGSMEAQTMLGQTWKLRCDLKTAIVLAAYAVFLAKEHVDGCGNFTDIVYLRNHAAAFVDRGIVQSLETVFRRSTKYLETPLLHRVLGANVPAMSGAGEMAEVLRRDIHGAGITLIEGLPSFDPTISRPTPPRSKRARKRLPPSLE